MSVSLSPISAVCLHFLGTRFQGSNNLCYPVPTQEGNSAGGNELSWAVQRISISSIYLEVSLTPVCLVQHEAVPRPSLHVVYSSSSWHQNKNILSALLLSNSCLRKRILQSSWLDFSAFNQLNRFNWVAPLCACGQFPMGVVKLDRPLIP